MMERMGHSSPRAALIYMHGNDARQREIAGHYACASPLSDHS
jgi:hypothetical protein